MAEMTLDSKELMAKVTVKITHLKEITWRTRIASWLIILAQYIAPFSLEIIEAIGEPCLLYCPYCGLDFATYFIPQYKTNTKNCPHCGRQCFIESDGEKAWSVKEPEPCDYGCGYIEPYGFVPEADCPVHDRDY